jgi:hypothetical protein
VKPIKFEAGSPGYLHQLPHVVVYIVDYKIGNQTIPVLGKIPQLFDYYQGFVKNLNATENADLKALSLELTANQPDELSKVKSIYYWVKDNIKYIAFENGYEGFIPREASMVYDRKFGDCKDMASIITSMAHYAGIKDVKLCWIGTREIPYKYEELPTPAADNHMIAVYKTENRNYFLDATDKYTSFGYPSSFIQGKEALVNNEGKMEIINVPIVNSQTNYVSDEVNMKIENDRIIGVGKLTLNGYNRGVVLSAFGDSFGKERQENIRDLTLKGNNKFRLKSYTEENLGNRDLPYIVNFNFEIDNYLVKIDDEMYINLCLDRRYEALILEDDREWKFDLDFLTKSNSKYQLEIPKGYKLKSVPKNFLSDNDVFVAKVTYTITNNNVLIDILFDSKKILLEKSDFKAWNATLKSIKSYFNESIILTKI